MSRTPDGHAPLTADGTARQHTEGRRSRRHDIAFWIIAYAFAVTAAFSTLPTPLYVLYQARDRFSMFMTTVVSSATPVTRFT